MNYILAVSGGVDSIVLLDLYAQSKHNLVVAHVDHGIRSDSADDARFVEAVAKSYKIPYVSKRFELGEGASEEDAREARYKFLFEQAKVYRAEIVTAHHLDDMVETIAINIHRGTGWRGLAVINRKSLHRPLLSLSKSQIYQYALKRRLEWVEDSTNRTDAYLRNRLRSKLKLDRDDVEALSNLRLDQIQLKREIDREVSRLTKKYAGSRYFLTQTPVEVAVEILSHEIKETTGVRPVASQVKRALVAVATAKPNTSFHVGEHVVINFSSRNYQVSVL